MELSHPFTCFVGTRLTTDFKRSKLELQNADEALTAIREALDPDVVEKFTQSYKANGGSQFRPDSDRISCSTLSDYSFSIGKLTILILDPSHRSALASLVEQEAANKRTEGHEQGHGAVAFIDRALSLQLQQ